MLLSWTAGQKNGITFAVAISPFSHVSINFEAAANLMKKQDELHSKSLEFIRMKGKHE